MHTYMHEAFKWKFIVVFDMHMYVHTCVLYVAPTCFNTTNCEGGSFSDNSLSYVQCCFELSGASFALSGECLLCPKGMYLIQINNTVNSGC